MIFDFLAVVLPIAFCLLPYGLVPRQPLATTSTSRHRLQLPEEVPPSRIGRIGFSFCITFGNSCPTDFGMSSLSVSLSISLTMQNSSTSCRLSRLSQPYRLSGPCIWSVRLVRQSVTHATCTVGVPYYCTDLPTPFPAGCNPVSRLELPRVDTSRFQFKLNLTLDRSEGDSL